MTPHIVLNLFLWLCLAIQITFTVRSIISYRKIHKSNQKFLDKLVADTEKWKNEFVDRQNLLSKENATLMEKNELYRDKLKNLGFTDITLDT